MTRRATFTQSELARAIRAAKAEGLVAVVLRDAIAFVESDKVALPSPDQTADEAAECDRLFGVSR